jgi:DNA-binding CsgD family transcriptional regulator
LEEAMDRGVIEMEVDRLHFTHPLLGSVLYSDAPVERRRNVHRRLAEVLSDPEERARHLALAAVGPDAVVAAALDEAAARAAARGAPNSAAEFAELARRLTPPEEGTALARRALDGAKYLFEAGNLPRSRQLLEEVSAGMQPGPERAEVLRRLGNVRGFDNWRVAAELMERAADEAGSDVALAANIGRDLAWIAMMGGDVRLASGHARAALALAEGLDDRGLLAEALTAVAFTDAVQGQGTPIDTIQRAVEVEEWTEGVRIFRHPSFMLGILLKWTDDFDGARRRFESMRRYAADRGDENSIPFILYHLSELETWAGNWDRALTYATESIGVARQINQEAMLAASLYGLALVQASLGRVDEARAAATEGLALAEKSSGAIRSMQNLAVLGFVELSVGNPKEARILLGRVHDLGTALGMTEHGAVRFLHNEVESLIALGELDRAGELTQLLEERPTDIGRRWGRAVGARCRGLWNAARGDLEAALQSLERAQELHEDVPEPFEQARTLLVLGSVRRRVKRKAEARETLTAAKKAFDGLGAKLWSDRALAEIARIGGRPPAPLDLTPTERRVAELVAAGQTNRQVADELFMSVRTVEINLTHIYRKLGVRSRTQLAALVRDNPDVPTN